MWTSLQAGSNAADEGEGAKSVRIVSINACTDQLLYALADRSQIAALTHYSVQDDFSIYAGEIEASGLKRIRGSAEEVLKLKPDMVLAGTYTRRATREMLKRLNMRVELFSPARNIAETREAIRRMAGLVGHAGRGEALIAQIDQALGAMPDLRKRDLSVLQIQRRGIVSGPETLIGDLLKALGVRNAAEQLGIGRIGQTSIEGALRAQADGLILFDPASRATDQGSAILLHPALNDIYPPSRRLAIPGRLIVCAGPALPMAIAELEGQLRNLRPRSETSE